jgi:hypothetical protein
MEKMREVKARVAVMIASAKLKLKVSNIFPRGKHQTVPLKTFFGNSVDFLPASFSGTERYA